MEKKVKKKKHFWSYLNPKNIKMEIHRYGYHFSMRTYIMYLLAVYAGIIAIAFVYKLTIVPILVIMGVATLFLPASYLRTYQNLYEQKRFEDLTNYMEQMLYAFQRSNKILTSLRDTLILFPEGDMHEAITKAIDHIQNASSSAGDIYGERGYGNRKRE